MRGGSGDSGGSSDSGDSGSYDVGGGGSKSKNVLTKKPNSMGLRFTSSRSW